MSEKLKALKVHYFQHVPFEGLGSIEAWLVERGHYLTETRFFLNQHPPPLSDIDWLIVPGGPMGAYEEEKHTWLSREKDYIRSAVAAGKPVIGVCLGAQLIASALGAAVYPNDLKEIGWFPVKKTPQASASSVFSGFPHGLPVFHWHGDTYDLPPGAIRVAESAACRNQAFVLGQRVIGLQFHLETTAEGARRLIENCADELVDAPYIQSAASMLEQPQRFDRINLVMGNMLRRLMDIA